MKTRIFATLAALLLTASAVSSATVATATDITPVAEVAPITTEITAPAVTLTNDAPTVTTEPAPVAEVPVTAPEPAPEAPIAPAPVPAPTEAPAPVVAAPEAPATEVPAPATFCPADFYKFAGGECIDPYSGNPYIDCEAIGLVRTEDSTCAAASFWTVPVEAAPVVECKDAKLGEAEMGFMLDCFKGEALTITRNFTYLGSAGEGLACATYLIPSTLYPGIIHSFKDDLPNSDAACNIK